MIINSVIKVWHVGIIIVKIPRNSLLKQFHNIYGPVRFFMNHDFSESVTVCDYYDI